jgi:EpsI family protein
MWMAAAMLLAASAAWLLTPRLEARQPRRALAEIVPTQFGEWTELRDGTAPVDPTNALPGERTMKSPYDDVLMRAYSNGKGQTIMLALAYGEHQRQEIKIHRPELCYVAQGFGVIDQTPTQFPAARIGERPIAGVRMLVGGPRRIEAVSYWIRIGDVYSDDAWQTRAYIFEQGLRGRVVDGLLMRVSQVLTDERGASADRYELQERFAIDLVHAVPPDERYLLTGGGTT